MTLTCVLSALAVLQCIAAVYGWRKLQTPQPARQDESPVTRTVLPQKTPARTDDRQSPIPAGVGRAPEADELRVRALLVRMGVHTSGRWDQ